VLPLPLPVVGPGVGALRPTSPLGGPNVVSVSPPHAAATTPPAMARPNASK
jgi:hypothetical protein